MVKLIYNYSITNENTRFNHELAYMYGKAQ